MFITSAVFNIFQNQNYYSLELEQLPPELIIATICLLNYFITADGYHTVKTPAKKKEQVWKLSKIA